MTDVMIGANRSKMLEIAQQITATFSERAETELRVDAEDVNGNWISLSFNSEDTDREDWNGDLVVVELEDS